MLFVDVFPVCAPVSLSSRRAFWRKTGTGNTVDIVMSSPDIQKSISQLPAIVQVWRDRKGE